MEKGFVKYGLVVVESVLMQKGLMLKYLKVFSLMFDKQFLYNLCFEDDGRIRILKFFLLMLKV